jgi:pyruvate formate lyase activating enzyme
MLISGIQQFTMLDYPDKMACIVFTPGCNFRCGYCHNPEFVLPNLLEKIKSSFIPEESFFKFLATRNGLLDAVVITGGEPTIMSDLPEFCSKIKEQGFLIKLDTNGSNPELLNDLIANKLIDYVAMDVKSSLEQYSQLVGPGVGSEMIRESISIIKNSGATYEFRSTILKESHPDKVLESMAKLMRGATKLYLQTFRPNNVLDQKFETYHSFSKAEMEAKADFFRKYVDTVEIRD